MVKMTIEEVKSKLKVLNSNIEIISDMYLGCNNKMRCKCLVDGHEWDMSWDALSQKRGCPVCSGGILTIEVIKARLKKISPNIEILSDKYINSDTKLKCRCLIDNYQWEMVWGSLLRGRGCHVCSGRVLTTELIKNKLAIVHPNTEIISGEWVNSSSKFTCRCKIDGYEWNTRWETLEIGAGCPKCSRRAKLTIEECRERLFIINPNIEIISNNYNNNNTKLQCKCKIDEHEWETTWANLQNRAVCPICSSRRKEYTIDEIKEKLKAINPNIEILSSVYVKTEENLKYRCLIDNYEWEQTWKALRHGAGCPRCFINSVTGENNWNWKGGISSLNAYLRSKIIEWKKESMRESKYRCVITGERFNEIHHIYSFDLIVEEVLKETNIPIYQEINQYTSEELDLLEKTCLAVHYIHGLGVCLTKEIHTKFHKLYGAGGNTPEQWDEFKEIMSKEFNKGA